MSSLKTSTIVVILAGLLGIVFVWYGLGLPPFNKPMPIEGVACTLDAMQCPDGSYVGRSGPNCEFVCPIATTTPTPTTGTGGGAGGGQGIAPYQSGIRGTLMAGPTCPVERDPPDPNCADKPVATNVQVFRSSDPTRAIATVTSSAQDTFEVSLPPGNYLLMSGPYGVPFPRCNDASATVGPNTYTQVLISCDTGIR